MDGPFQDFVADFGKLVLAGKHTDPVELWNAMITIISGEVENTDPGGCASGCCMKNEDDWGDLIREMKE